MLLILTNSLDATADYLVSKLQAASVPYLRIDTDTILDHISFSYEPGRPELTVDGQRLRATDFTSVWYRRPERLASSRIPESPEGKCVLNEWSESLEAFFTHVPRERWMNFPAANALASRKLEQLTVAQDIELLIPDTLVTQEPKRLLEFYRKHKQRIVVKPLGHGYIQRTGTAPDSIIFTNEVSEPDLNDLSDLYNCPTLFQQYVNKISDVRVTIVDGDVHGVELLARDVHGKQRCDIRRDNMVDVQYRQITLPGGIEDKLRRLVSHYKLRFAAIDMAVSVSGDWYFLEVNPNGQWAWLDLLGVTSIHASFTASFSHAIHAVA